MYSESTKQEIQDGLSWYITANKRVLELADKYTVSPEKVAGIIAALSPAVSWTQNLSDANNLISNMVRGTQTKIRVTTYGKNKLKAVNIYNSNSFEEIDRLLIGCSKIVNKTYSFYRNILEPEVSNTVTVDRHAIRIAMEEILKDVIWMTEKRYRTIRDAYIKSAKKLGLRPHELQAIVWLTFRRLLLEFDNVPF